MRFEVYVRDGELRQAFKDFFSLFQKYRMFIQRAQTHVVLSKKKKKGSAFEREHEQLNETNLD